MGVPFRECADQLKESVRDLFGTDPQVQAVGIARHGGGFGFKAVKNAARIVPSGGGHAVGPLPAKVNGIPVIVETVHTSVAALRAAHPLATSFVAEQNAHRPLTCGLQVQNFDDDDRRRTAGLLQPGYIVIGTLGGFVTLNAGGQTAILSNNHVLAGENRGHRTRDRILQPGNVTFSTPEHVATLTEYVSLLVSPPGARPAAGTVIYNQVDAAVAELVSGVAFGQNYLAAHALPNPSGTAAPRVGDKVFKVGRTTGLTRGEITAVGTTVGPVGYEPGDCWFQNQFEIVGDDGVMFSDHGDSGSLVVSTTGEVVGLLFAGDGVHTYANPIDDVLSKLNCSLV